VLIAATLCFNGLAQRTTSMMEPMARRRVAAAAALLWWSTVLDAAVVTLTPFPKDATATRLEILEAPQRLALVARTAAPAPVLLELDAATLQAQAIPTPARIERIALLGSNNYIGLLSQPQASGPSALSLVRFDRRGSVLGTLYATRNEPYALIYQAALDQSGVYVTEQSGANRSKLTRIAANGRVQWQRDQVGTVLDAIAVPEGLLTRSSSNRLTLVAAGGNTLWTKQLPRGEAELVFVPPDRVGIRNRPTPERWTLSLLQTTNGEFTRSVDLPHALNLRATPRGLLVHGTLAHYPFIMLIDHDGVIRWTSRFRLARERAALSDALLTRDGRVLIAALRELDAATNPANPLGAAPLVMAADDIKELIEHSSECFGTDGREIDSLELELYHQQALRIGPVLAPRAADADGHASCLGPTDTEYLRLLRELKQRLAPFRPKAEPSQLTFFVNVVVNGPALTLEQYTFDTLAIDVPRTSLHWAVTPDAGSALQQMLTLTVRPHLQRMRAYQNRFKALTGNQFSVRLQDPQQLADPTLLEQLEHSAQTVVSSIAALPAQQRAALRLESGRAVFIALAPGKFGLPLDMRDVEAAPSTLQQLVDEARQRAR
jgi:hypothetical protein